MTKPKLTPTFTDLTRDPNWKPALTKMPNIPSVPPPSPPPIIFSSTFKITKSKSRKPKPVKPTIVPPHEPLKNETFTPPPAGSMAAAVPLMPPSPPQAEPAPLKIALIGTAPSSRHLAPYDDPTWQIWACSAGNMNQLPRVDTWFEIHSNLLWPENQHFGKPYVEWLRQQSFPVYMQDTSLVERATPLPAKELVAEFGPYFFTSSFAWMMAMALKVGAKEVALFGIDMASREEYILQRPGAYFFFLEARRRGVKMFAPNESDIMQPPPLYGFSDSMPYGRKVLSREKELKDRIGPMKQQMANLDKQITYLEGALEDVDYWKSIWSGVDKPWWLS